MLHLYIYRYNYRYAAPRVLAFPRDIAQQQLIPFFTRLTIKNIISSLGILFFVQWTVFIGSARTKQVVIGEDLDQELQHALLNISLVHLSSNYLRKREKEARFSEGVSRTAYDFMPIW